MQAGTQPIHWKMFQSPSVLNWDWKQLVQTNLTPTELLSVQHLLHEQQLIKLRGKIKCNCPYCSWQLTPEPALCSLWETHYLWTCEAFLSPLTPKPTSVPPCHPIWDSLCTHWLWQSPDYFFSQMQVSPLQMSIPYLFPLQSTTLPAASTALSWWECPFILSHQAHEHICTLPLWRCAHSSSGHWPISKQDLRQLGPNHGEKLNQSTRHKTLIARTTQCLQLSGTHSLCGLKAQQLLRGSTATLSHRPQQPQPWVRGSQRQLLSGLQYRHRVNIRGKSNQTQPNLCQVQGQGPPVHLWVQLSPPEHFLQHLLAPRINQQNLSLVQLPWTSSKPLPAASGEHKLNSEQGQSRWEQNLRVKHQ